MKEDKRYFVDTNVFVGFFVPDKFHNECQKLLSLIQLRKLRVFTSTIVLSEINYVLGKFYNFPKDEVIKALRAITSLKGLGIEDVYSASTALDLYRAHNVKFIDCFIASMPQVQTGKIVLVSYDQDFDKLKVKRLEPKQIT